MNALAGLNLGWIAGLLLVVGVGVLNSQGWVDSETVAYVRGAVIGGAGIHTLPKLLAKAPGPTIGG